MKIKILLLLVFFCSACASKNNFKVNFDPLEPLHVAVMPFYQKTDSGYAPGPIIFQSKNLAKDIKEAKKPQTAIVQEEIEDLFQDTALQLISPGTIRANLVHNGFSKDHSYDYQKILNTTPSSLAKVLHAEALLYGELTEWDQSYYGIQTVNTVGMKLKLLDKNGKLLFETDTVDNSSRGISGIPTGYTSIVLEPLKGLQDSEIQELSKEVVEEALAPILIKNQTQYKNTPPPAIFAATHNGKQQKIKSKPLKVFAIGTSQQTATFSIGDTIINNPMIEIFPGHYYGEYHPLQSDQFEKTNVSISIYDKFGRSVTSDAGLVSLQ